MINKKNEGSILGPLFFLVYINDLTEGLKCNVKLFADDTSIFTVVQDPDAAALDMNHKLNLINRWSRKWRMFFNPDPSKQAVEVIFSRKRISLNHPNLLFNGSPVTTVTEHKHLRIVLDAKLSFANRIWSVVSKSRKSIGMLKCLSKYLPRQTLDGLYKLYVRPHVDYRDIIYHTPQTICEFTNIANLSNQIEKLESIQYSAALAVKFFCLLIMDIIDNIKKVKKKKLDQELIIRDAEMHLSVNATDSKSLIEELLSRKILCSEDESIEVDFKRRFELTKSVGLNARYFSALFGRPKLIDQ